MEIKLLVQPRILALASQAKHHTEKRSPKITQYEESLREFLLARMHDRRQTNAEEQVLGDQRDVDRGRRKNL